jgi:hypothetical protein
MVITTGAAASRKVATDLLGRTSTHTEEIH